MDFNAHGVERAKELWLQLPLVMGLHADQKDLALFVVGSFARDLVAGRRRPLQPYTLHIEGGPGTGKTKAVIGALIGFQTILVETCALCTWEEMHKLCLMVTNNGVAAMTAGIQTMDSGMFNSRNVKHL